MLDLELDTNAYDECLRALNRQFQELTQQAKDLQTRFMEQEHEGKMLPVLITVIEDKRYRSTAIRWSRAIPTRKDGKKHILAKAIPKGRDTHKYPASAFSFLEPELQAKVWHYEEMLSLLRYSLARNCLGKV